MAVRLLKNPYKGINAHLHSLAQNPDRSPTIWTSIHASHIGDITNALNQQLPPHYIARAEQSLQVWTENIETGDEAQKTPRPDTAVYRSSLYPPTQPTRVTEVTETEVEVREISIKDLLLDEISTSAVVVYRPDDHENLGEPVTRIELFSPGNKTWSGYQAYFQNRLMALQSGTSLIEMDYLHQSPSPLPGIPRYPHEKGSHAYSLAVTDRRPGKNPDVITRVYEFSVDSPVPTQVSIPLAGEDSLTFDFNVVYQHTFEIGRWGVHIDYEQPPRNLGSYSPADQKRIQAVMARAKLLLSS